MSKRWINYLNIKKPHLSSVFISKRSWYASRIIFRPEPLSLTGKCSALPKITIYCHSVFIPDAKKFVVPSYSFFAKFSTPNKFLTNIP